MRMLTRLLAAASLLAALAPAAALARDGDIVSRRPYRFPPLDRMSHADRYVDRADYDSTVADRRFRMERIEYRSDSLVVPAYLYAPVAPARRPAPCVVFVRGSWTIGDIGWQLAPTFRRLAERGFVVIAPLIRGSDGAAGRDDMGGDDVNDVLHAADLAARTGLADRSRLYLYGESRGGMTVLLAASLGFPAKAVATYGAFSDLDSMIAADTTALEPVARTIWPDWPTHRDAIAARRSAARWPGRLRVPLLLLHGADDRQVSPAQSQRLADAVTRAGGRAEVRVFDGAGHTLRGREAERDSLAAEWFRKATRPGR